MEWSEFYQNRDRVLRWIDTNCNNLHTITGHSISDFLKNQQKSIGKREQFYIRQIFHIAAQPSVELEIDLNELRENYQSLTNNDKSRYPNYFPLVFDNVTQINCSQNPAYQSKTYTRKDAMNGANPLTITSERFGKRRLKEIKQIFEYEGIDSEFFDFGSMTLIDLNLNDVMSHFHTNKLKVRHSTGTQYIARIKQHGKSTMMRRSHGLIVCIGNAPEVYQSLPQSKRSHAGKSLGQRLTFQFISEQALGFDMYRP